MLDCIVILLTVDIAIPKEDVDDETVSLLDETDISLVDSTLLLSSTAIDDDRSKDVEDKTLCTPTDDEGVVVIVGTTL
jgi:hypothetical protein